MSRKLTSQWNQLKYYAIQTISLYVDWFLGGARGVMAIVVGNGHGDTSSNPGRA